ncbi:MAG: aminomethyl transferase family protein [Betaproteobacteria bacterium]|nr:MAG: aminomethyl transferase family protein [Betaproteobacteria bacterium]
MHRQWRLSAAALPVNPHEEHLATRRAAGLFDFSFMGLFEFSGAAALDRLQSRRLTDIEPGRAAYTLLLNDDGSVFNDATVWNMGADRWWLFTGRRPASGAILAHLIGADTIQHLRYFHFVDIHKMLVARLGYSGELGYELVLPAPREMALRKALLEAGDDRLRECSFAAADSLRIESGYVLFDREIDGRANPRELGLERLVSDPGRTFGLSRKLVGLEFTDRPAHVEVPSAHVTSECDSPTLGKRIALSFAAPDAKPGDGVKLDDGRVARVAKLPFYDPGKQLPRAAPL